MNLQDRNTQITIVAILAPLILLYILYNRSITPKKQLLKEKTEELDKIKELSNQRKRKAATLESLQEEYNDLQVQWEQMKNFFPAEEEVPVLINQISRAEKSAGVYIESFKPLLSTPKDVYVENTYQLRIRGGYHSFSEFLYNLSEFSRIISVSKIKILSSGENKGGKKSEFTINVDCILTSYTLKGPR